MKEAFIDTNPLIRYLTNDIPQLAQKVENLLGKTRKRQIKLIINELIIAEIVWVLESMYDLTKDEIYELLKGIFHTHNLEIPNKVLLKEASEVYKDKNIPFL